MELKVLVQNLCLVAVIQALVFVCIFFSKSTKNTGAFFLGLFLFVFAGTSIQWYFHSILPPFSLMALTFSYAILPIYYLYTKCVVGQYQHKLLWHLFPAGIELLFNIGLSVFPSYAQQIYQPQADIYTITFLIIIPPIYNLIYCILVYINIKQSQHHLLSFITSFEAKRLRWIQVTAAILGADFILELLSSLGMLMSNLDMYLYILEALVTLFIIYWVSIFGLKQNQIIPVQSSLIPVNNNSEKFNTLNKEEELNIQQPTSSENHEKNDSELQRVIQFFTDTKIYTNKEVSLFMVADLLQIHYKDLSKLINKGNQTNFNQFVNKFRIEEAKKLLLDESKQHLNLNGIAQEVGFNSRSTFFAAFKSIEGITPNEFKKIGK